MSLAGRKILVTGGAGAIGRSIVSVLQAQGARMAVIDLPGAALENLRKAQPELTALAGDLADPGGAERSVEEIWRLLGGVDVLVNCVGLIHSAPLVNIANADRKHPIEAWRRVIDANLNAVFYTVREIADRMVTARTRGVIVNISSISAAGNAGQSAYAAAKAGVEALTAVWAKELGTFGIRTVAVAPGFIDTESTRNSLTEKQLEQLRQRIPLRRLGAAEDVAGLVLTAIENPYLNGTTLALDGGLVL